jgi:hypothetical protein
MQLTRFENNWSHKYILIRQIGEKTLPPTTSDHPLVDG